MNYSGSKFVYFTVALFTACVMVAGCATSRGYGTSKESRTVGKINETKESGSLKLVSLGTGDTDNMTLMAMQAVSKADIVFTMGGRTDYYGDLLTGKTIYDAGHRLYAKSRVKKGGGHRMHNSPEELAKMQEKTRRIIRDAVAGGKHVVIIDNGDPTIFGPHIDYMREFSDLGPEIIPGLSSFNAANAALQTSMVAGKTMAVTLTVGRLENGRDKMIADMIQSGQTLVFFMVRDFKGFIDGLNALLPDDTPVAIVSWAGSREKQQVIKGSLGTILGSVGQERIPNFLLYVGASLKDIP